MTQITKETATRIRHAVRELGVPFEHLFVLINPRNGGRRRRVFFTFKVLRAKPRKSEEEETTEIDERQHKKLQRALKFIGATDTVVICTHNGKKSRNGERKEIEVSLQN